MIERIQIESRAAWFKRYDGGRRRLRLAALRVIARGLRVPALLPPSHPVGAHACGTEQRRIAELARCDVRVPEVLSRGKGFLILSDLGPSLASELKGSPPALREQLIVAAARALARVHASGAYVGQPLARNVTVSPEGIGFIDLEEDPGEVMPLLHAQARDWLLFTAGTAYHAATPDWFAWVVAEALRSQPHLVDELSRVARRLRAVEFTCRGLGRRARRVAFSLNALRTLS